MSTTLIQPPFDAYQGDQPFIFVSYAHGDAASVFPDLRSLREIGYRIWHDEGIDSGNEWPEEIADALSRAAMFLVFISPRSVGSRNVKNEINFALQRDKPFVAIHIEETALPPGLQLQISSLQAIMRNRMDVESFTRKIRKALPESLRDSRKEPQIVTAASIKFFADRKDIHNVLDQLRKEEIPVDLAEDYAGASPESKLVRQLIMHWAASDTSVLIVGESGTGKSIVANYLHKYPR